MAIINEPLVQSIRLTLLTHAFLLFLSTIYAYVLGVVLVSLWYCWNVSFASIWLLSFVALTDLVKGQIDRWVFTEDHVAMLEASFLKNPYVSSADKALFAHTIGCGEDKVYNIMLPVCAPSCCSWEE